MKTSLLAVAAACLVIGGYGSGYAMYQPKIAEYEAQVSNLKTEASNLKGTIVTKETEVTTLNQKVSIKETQISTLQFEKSDLQSEVGKLNQTVSAKETQLLSLEADKSKLKSDLSLSQDANNRIQSQLSSSQAQVSSLQSKQDKILKITVTQHYDWTHMLSRWQWDLPIPMSLYVDYIERPRTTPVASWVKMATDPDDDSYIHTLVQKINEAALKQGFSESSKINFVVAFVQSLPYTVDSVTTPYNEYPRYPIETLFDRGGDCEDTSILTAALLDRMGYDLALLHLKNAKHMALGISLPTQYGSYYDYGSKKYYYLETTGEGWQIGQIPTSITDKTAYVYPLRG